MGAGLIVLGTLAVLVSCIYQLFRRLSRSAATIASLLLTGLVAALPGVLAWEVARESPKLTDLSQVPYRTSTSCVKCHSDHYASWHRTYHRTMTQEALPENVLGDFNDLTVWFNRLPCRMFRDGDRFFMELVDPQWESEVLSSGGVPGEFDDPPVVQFQIDRLVGSHHIQVYLTRRSDGSYMLLPLVWHTAEHRWIPRAEEFLRPPLSVLYTREETFRWNAGCVSCHNTFPNPGLTLNPESPERDPVWNTRFAELGIACEACHGPGASHIAVNRNPVRRFYLHENGGNDPTIVNPAKLSKELSVEACGRCHGKWQLKATREWLTKGDNFVPGRERLNVRHAMLGPHATKTKEDDERLSRGLYWRDMSPKTTAFEYAALTFSTCYRRGEITCLSCHSMHQTDPDGQLKRFGESGATGRVESDQACLQCHERFAPREQLEQHTFHSADSSGSRCYNCHMPFQAYGLLRAVRNHRIASPSMAVTTRTQLPNACNQCHVDRSLEWTAQWLERWYGQPMPALSEDQKVLSATVVDLLQGDALCRALAASRLGWAAARDAAPGAWRIPFLAYALDDSYAAVRYTAHQSLRKLPGFEDIQFDYLADMQTRQRQIEELQRRWNQLATHAPFEPNPFIPLRSDGQVDHATVDRLLKEQDQTEVILVQ